MAIKRMISRDVEEFRAFQTRMVGVGRIRLGEYVVPEGKRGRPVKLDRFRLTSDNEGYIRVAAEQYGGEVRQYQPQGGGPQQWEVITTTDALYVYIVNGQHIDPVYEAWGAGRTCVRRCDGEWNTVMQEPCICNSPEQRPADPRQLCKITTRVNVMLPRVAGLNSWLLETHSENAAIEMAAPNVAGLARVAPMPVPAMLRLRKEQRRERNHQKGTFETKDFYVPWFDIDVVSAEQLVGGREGFAQALIAGGAPALMAAPEDRRALEAAPVSAPVPPPAPVVDNELRAKILSKIERQETVAGLEEVKALLRQQGITDQAVIDAWKSKLAGVRAVDKLASTVTQGRPYRVLVTGSRTWSDVAELEGQLDIARTVHPGRMVLVHGKCPSGADAQAAAWAERHNVPVEEHPADWDAHGKKAGFLRNQAMVDTRPDIVLSFNRGGSSGTEHCTAAAEAAGLKVLRFTDDTPVERKVPCLNPYCGGTPEACGFSPMQHMQHHGPAAIVEADRAAGRIPGTPEYQVGDTVTVGGIEFTKISDNPFPPGTPAAQLFGQAEMLEQINDQFAADLDDAISGTVEPVGPALPDVPDGDYDADEVYTNIMTAAGRQEPPLTTAEVNKLIIETFQVEQLKHATGLQLARLRAGLKSGAVQWR